MSSLLSLNGHIYGLESNLLTKDKLERMIEAPNSEKAFSVFVELSYAKYIDESVTAGDFQRIIDQGLAETKNLITPLVESNPLMQALWLRYDISNIKAAFKALYIKGDDLEDFESQPAWNVYGDLTLADIKNLLRDGTISGNVPAIVLAVIVDYVSKGQNIDISLVHEFEMALDQAYFRWLSQMLMGSGDVFFSAYFKALVDHHHLTVVARSLVSDTEIPDSAWLDFGSISYDQAKSISDFNAWKELLSRTFFASMEIEELTAGEEIIDIERCMDSHLMQWLMWQARGNIGTWAVPIWYYETRLRYAQIIQYVMFGKMYGLSADQIRKNLAHSTVNLPIK